MTIFKEMEQIAQNYDLVYSSNNQYAEWLKNKATRCQQPRPKGRGL